MTLETFSRPEDLYLARGSDVNPYRPLFTGDVLDSVRIPGIQEGGMAVVLAHPCSMRRGTAKLRPRTLVASVTRIGTVGPAEWSRGHYRRSPLPELAPGADYAVEFESLGQAETVHLRSGKRLACASVFGVNLLQQRLIHHLTRFAPETFRLHEVSAHTFEEADLLEEWNDTILAAGVPEEASERAFEEFLAQESGPGRTFQSDLRDPQWRSSVRSACRRQAMRVADQAAPRGE